MILIALFSAALGVALGRWLKVFVLVPASFLLWCAAFVYVWVQGLSLLQGIVTALLGVTCLQFAYLGSAAWAGVQDASRKRRGVMTVH